MNTLHELSEWNWEAEDNEGLLQVVTNQLGIEQIKHLVEALRQLRDLKKAANPYYTRDETDKDLEEFMEAADKAIDHWVWNWEVYMEIEEVNRYSTKVEARTLAEARTIAYSEYQDENVTEEINVYSEGKASNEIDWNIERVEE